MSNIDKHIDKQALRGQELTPRYYLAHCLECGVIMPSNKLIESRNYPDGDADCYCPHCNANDCDIDDLGTGESPGVVAWNYQQKRIEALLDELEAKDRLNAELMEKQRLIDICQGQGLEHRIAAEKRAEAAEKRIAELEVLATTKRPYQMEDGKWGCSVCYKRHHEHAIDAALCCAAAGKGEAS